MYKYREMNNTSFSLELLANDWIDWILWIRNVGRRHLTVVNYLQFEGDVSWVRNVWAAGRGGNAMNGSENRSTDGIIDMAIVSEGRNYGDLENRRWMWERTKGCVAVFLITNLHRLVLRIRNHLNWCWEDALSSKYSFQNFGWGKKRRNMTIHRIDSR